MFQDKRIEELERQVQNIHDKVRTLDHLFQEVKFINDHLSAVESALNELGYTVTWHPCTPSMYVMKKNTKKGRP